MDIEQKLFNAQQQFNKLTLERLKYIEEDINHHNEMIKELIKVSKNINEILEQFSDVLKESK